MDKKIENKEMEVKGYRELDSYTSYKEEGNKGTRHIVEPNSFKQKVLILRPVANKIMGLPFAQIAKVINDIINSDNQQKVYTDIDLMECENPSLTAFIKDDKTKAIVYDAMYDRHNQLIGCLVLEYHVPLEEGHLNLDQLKVQTAELSSILNIIPPIIYYHIFYIF